jgi:hypothetical protein
MGQPKGIDRFLIENAIKYLNKFLKGYRSATSFYWITTLSPDEVIRFQIADRHEDDSVVSRSKFVTDGPVKFGPIDDRTLTRV